MKLCLRFFALIHVRHHEISHFETNYMKFKLSRVLSADWKSSLNLFLSVTG